MSTYGRNFEFRTTPRGADREGRWQSPSTALPIGVPAVYDSAATVGSLALPILKLAPADSPRAGGMKGIMVYEHAPAAFAGYDEALTTYSDIDTVPANKATQLVHGDYVKVVLRNTTARTFLQTRSYTGRVMVDLTGLAVGNYLTPGTGNDTAGYWKKTTTEANAWLVVTSIDTTRAEVEARMYF